MPFETFKKQRTNPGDSPHVTIQRKGVFSINKSAFEALGSPETVELLWDDASRLIGLRKVDPSVGHAYIVRPLGRGTTYLISGTAFTKYYGIETPESRRWPASFDGDLLIVDLKNKGQEVISNRNIASRVEPAQQSLSGVEQVSPR
jgi:hypothetical protein